VPAVQTARDLGGADRGAGGPAGTGQPGECPVGRILGINIAMRAASCYSESAPRLERSGSIPGQAAGRVPPAACYVLVQARGAGGGATAWVAQSDTRARSSVGEAALSLKPTGGSRESPRVLQSSTLRQALGVVAAGRWLL
jgi:hypothetical protein